MYMYDPNTGSLFLFYIVQKQRFQYYSFLSIFLQLFCCILCCAKIEISILFLVFNISTLIFMYFMLCKNRDICTTLGFLNIYYKYVLRKIKKIMLIDVLTVFYSLIATKGEVTPFLTFLFNTNFLFQIHVYKGN